MRTHSFLAGSGRLAPTIVLLVATVALAPVAAQDDPFAAVPEETRTQREQTGESAEPAASHVQTAIIKVVDEAGQSLPLHTFCLTPEGKILAGVGNGPGQIRVFDADGHFVEAWETSIRPEAINIGPGGSVYVAGSGKMLKLDANGKVLAESPTPNAGGLKTVEESVRRQVVDMFKEQAQGYSRQIEMIGSQIDRFKQMIRAIDDKQDEITTVEQRRREILVQQIEQFEQARKQYEEMSEQEAYEPDEQQVEQTVQQLLQMRTRVSSISATDTNAYLACPAIEGFGFEVWRMGPDFDNPTRIITELRGCCGQMDVQAFGEGLYVAENGRFRVCRYDRQGNLVLQWGSREREGLDGFGSCCNPMNVAFGPGGEIYTAEASLGRVKRYSPDGELRGLVGRVDIVPGCKNVAIGVSPDGKRVYMMDMTRSHIVVMSEKPGLATVETTVN